MSDPGHLVVKLSYRDLSEDDAALITNGCGGKGSWVKPPNWLFKASCNHHDFEYWRGGCESDRAHADWGFYTAMVEDAKDTPWWYPSWLAKVRAWIYYKAVRRWGKPYFSYGPMRTRVDLEQAKLGKVD